MKTLFILAISLMVSTGYAAPVCEGEAQIIAKVGPIKSKTMLSCVVEIDASSIQLYNMSGVCPLDIDEVLATGVSVGLKDGHDCALSEGDVISGVIVKKPWGILVLE